MEEQLEDMKAKAGWGRGIWISNFFCAFFLILTVFLLRGYTASQKENQLTDLSVAQTAQSAASLLMQWQERQTSRLFFLAQDGDYPDQAALERHLAANPDWQAVFSINEDGALIGAAGARFEQAQELFWDLAGKNERLKSVTVFLPSPFRRVAIGVPDYQTGYICALLDSGRFGEFLRDKAPDAAVTITDGAGIALFSTDGLIAPGREFLKQKGHMMPRGGQLFTVYEAAGQAALYRVGNIGPFDWSLHIEKPFSRWPVPQMFIYVGLFLSLSCFALSLSLYYKRPAGSREDDERSARLRKRMQGIVDIDHKDGEDDL